MQMALSISRHEALKPCLTPMDMPRVGDMAVSCAAELMHMLSTALFVLRSRMGAPTSS